MNEVAKELLEDNQKPFNVEGIDYYLNSSIGISSLAANDISFSKMVQESGIAMGESKRMGENQYIHFTDIEKRSLYLSILDMEKDLRYAIDNDELIIHFQPIFNHSGESIETVEALIRWQSPKKGLISPGEFIPVAEALNLMPKIGLWVLNESVKVVKKWNHTFSSHVGVAVNVSKSQIREVEFVDQVEQILKENDFPPSLLQIELTESDVFDELEEIIQFCKKLRKLGVKVALDDFGVGTSSLTYLRELPIDIVKIDREFIKKIPTDYFSEVLLSSMYEIFNSLGLKVVTEGVENIDQFQYIKACSKSKIQGFLLSSPLSIKVFEETYFRVSPSHR